MDHKNLTYGVVVSHDQPRKDGLYWGYSVRAVEDVECTFMVTSGEPCSTVIGTSEKGSHLQSLNLKFDANGSLLIVFGGVNELEFAFENSSKLKSKTCEESFELLLELLPRTRVPDYQNRRSDVNCFDSFAE